MRAKTTRTADTSELHAEYFRNYNEISALPAEGLQAKINELQARLNEKEQRILGLETIVSTALARPINLTQEQKQNMTGTYHNQSRNVSTGGGDAIGIIQGDNSTISGTVAKTINQLPDSSSEQPGIKELLVQLQEAIAAELPETAKEKALPHVNAIAEAAQNPDSDESKSRVQLAKTFFEGVGVLLGPTASVAVIINAIAKWFGLG